MLVVLLVGAVAALASASLIGAVLAAAATDGADRGREACAASAEAGLARLVGQLRWGMVAADASAEFDDATVQPSVTTRLSVAPALTVDDGTVFRRLSLSAVSSAGVARVARRATVRLRPGSLPHGLAAAGDLVVLAPVEVAGCGVYVGGDVYGRELIRFAGAGGPLDAPPDLLYPEVYSAVAVHAGGAIFTAEGEVHDLTTPSLDTDVHVGETDAVRLSALPSPAVLAALRRHAVAAGAALTGDELRVDLLPAQPAPGADPRAGVVVSIAAAEHPGPLVVTGRRPPPPLACPLVLIVEGDAVLGDEASVAVDEVACELCGALLATGSLRVAAGTRLTGSLAGAGVVVGAPLGLTLDEAWLAWPPAGCRVFEVLWRS